MSSFPIGDLVRCILPFRRNGEVVLMLQAFFDDSGTHGDSGVVVWGGIVGSIPQIQMLERAWDLMLSEPLPGKSKLSKFGLSDCKNRKGEFVDYNYGESDALRYRAREIIQQSGVKCIAYAVPIVLYNTIIRGRVRRDFGEPDGLAFASCADFAIQVSQNFNGAPLACIFDKGRSFKSEMLYIQDAEKRANALGVAVSYAFAAVSDSYGLQAADTVATEHYWYGIDCLSTDEPEIKPHFKSLIDMTEPSSFTLSAANLHELRRKYYKMYPIRKWVKDRLHRKLLPW